MAAGRQTVALTESATAFQRERTFAIMDETLTYAARTKGRMSTEVEAPTAAAPAAIDESHLIRSVIRLAWPVVVQQVSFSMVQLVDTALVGHLGENALAGVRLAGQIFWFSQTGMVAVGIG